MNSSSQRGHRSKIHPSDLKEAAEATHSSSSNKVNMKEKKASGFMSNNDEDTFWVVEENDAFIARKVSGRNFKFKKRKGKGKAGNKKGSPQRGGFKPFRKSGSGGKANMANENYDPYDQAYWGKGKGKKRMENQNSNIPMMETKVIHPMRVAKERADREKENPRRSQPPQKRRRSSPPLHHP